MADDAAAAGEMTKSQLPPTDSERQRQPDTDATGTRNVDDEGETSDAQPRRRSTSPLWTAVLVGAVYVVVRQRAHTERGGQARSPLIHGCAPGFVPSAGVRVTQSVLMLPVSAAADMAWLQRTVSHHGRIRRRRPSPPVGTAVKVPSPQDMLVPHFGNGAP